MGNGLWLSYHGSHSPFFSSFLWQSPSFIGDFSVIRERIFSLWYGNDIGAGTKEPQTVCLSMQLDAFAFSASYILNTSSVFPIFSDKNLVPIAMLLPFEETIAIKKFFMKGITERNETTCAVSVNNLARWVAYRDFCLSLQKNKMKDDIFKSISQGGGGEEIAENRRIYEIADGLRRGCQLYEAQLRDSQSHVNH